MEEVGTARRMDRTKVSARTYEERMAVSEIVAAPIAGHIGALGTVTTTSTPGCHACVYGSNDEHDGG